MSMNASANFASPRPSSIKSRTPFSSRLAIGQAGQVVRNRRAGNNSSCNSDLIRDIGRRRDVVARAVNDDRVTNDFECAIGGVDRGDFAAARTVLRRAAPLRRAPERARARRPRRGAWQLGRAMPYRGGVGVERRAIGGFDAEAQRQLATIRSSSSRGLDRLPRARCRAHVPNHYFPAFAWMNDASLAAFWKAQAPRDALAPIEACLRRECRHRDGAAAGHTA